MTMKRIEEMRALEAEAAPTPWGENWCYGAVRHIGRNVDYDAFYTPEDPENPEGGWGRYDGKFIATMRNNLPFMLNWITRAAEFFKANAELFDNGDEPQALLKELES